MIFRDGIYVIENMNLMKCAENQIPDLFEVWICQRLFSNFNLIVIWTFPIVIKHWL